MALPVVMVAARCFALAVMTVRLDRQLVEISAFCQTALLVHIPDD